MPRVVAHGSAPRKDAQAHATKLLTCHVEVSLKMDCFRSVWKNPGFRKCIFINTYMDVSENSGFSPQIIHFNRVFHYFHHPFWGPTIFAKTHIHDFFLKVLSLHILHYHQFPVAHVTLKFSKISNLNTRKTTDHLGRAKGPLPFPEVRCYISPRYEVRRFPRTISVVDRKGRYDLKFKYYRSTSRNNENNNNNNNNSNSNSNNIFLKQCYPFPGGPFVVIEMLQQLLGPSRQGAQSVGALICPH